MKNIIEEHINNEPKALCRKYKIKNIQKGEFKILVMGHYYSGKTFIIYHLAYNRLIEQSYSTIIPIVHSIKYKNGINLEVWDTTGYEDWLYMNCSSFYGSDAILWVCSYDYENAYLDFKNLFEEHISKYVPDIPIFLVVNKSDLDKSLRKLSNEDVEKLRKDPFFEDSFVISAKNHEQIIEVFDNVVNKLLSLYPIRFLQKNEENDLNQNSKTQCQIQ